MMLDYYKVLGVSSRASATEIKRAYRRLARQHHPDLNAQAQDEQIKRLNEAYEVLSNPRKRADYDKQRREILQRAAAARREREEASREPKMSWTEGVVGFVHELKKEQEPEQPAPPKAEPKLTWAEGMGAFVRELKKEMRDDQN